MNPRQVVERVFAMINSGDFTEIREVVDEAYADHGSPLGDVTGPDGFVGLVTAVRSAFSDYHNELDLIVVEGDMAAWRATITGVHTGALMGIPPTGKRVSFQSYNFGRVKDGKAIEHWALVDTASLMRQLGVAP